MPNLTTTGSKRLLGLDAAGAPAGPDGLFSPGAVIVSQTVSNRVWIGKTTSDGGNIYSPSTQAAILCPCSTLIAP